MALFSNKIVNTICNLNAKLIIFNMLFEINNFREMTKARACVSGASECAQILADSIGVSLLILTPTCRHMRGVLNHLPVCVVLCHM